MANITDLHVVNTMPGGIITNTPLNCQRAKEISKWDLARCPICQMRVVFLGGVGVAQEGVPMQEEEEQTRGTDNQQRRSQPRQPTTPSRPRTAKATAPPRRRSPVHFSAVA